jgi:hypothetical protein
VEARLYRGAYFDPVALSNHLNLSHVSQRSGCIGRPEMGVLQSQCLQILEHDAKKRPEVLRLMARPGVGPVTGLAL